MTISSASRINPFSRPLARSRRRRHVGRAYDMAKEIAPHLPGASAVLDVGCGNGFIAHHLAAMLDSAVIGVDLAAAPEAPIAYQRFDGRQLPFDDGAFDAALLCYVLHHSRAPEALLAEVCRVLAPGGRVVVYEDLPATWLDRLLCAQHDRAWRTRGGAPSFHSAATWERIFSAVGLRVLRSRTLSRLRDASHPIRRAFYVLERGAQHSGARR